MYALETKGIAQDYFMLEICKAGNTRKTCKVIICCKCNKIGLKVESCKSQKIWKKKTSEDCNPLRYKSNDSKSQKGKNCIIWRRKIEIDKFP